MNWKNLQINWAVKNDAEVAEEFGTSRQNVAAARKRLGAPKSPAGHGGRRYGKMTVEIRKDGKWFAVTSSAFPAANGQGKTVAAALESFASSLRLIK